MAKKETRPAEKPAKLKPAPTAHALDKRMRKMAAPGGKGQFTRMLAMTQPVKKRQAVTE